MHWCTKLGTKDAVLFHQQNCAKLCQCEEFEVTPKFDTVNSTPFACKIGVSGTKAAGRMLIELNPGVANSKLSDC